MKIYYLFLGALFILTAIVELILIFSKKPKLIKIRSALPKPLVITIAAILAAYGVYYIITAFSR